MPSTTSRFHDLGLLVVRLAIGASVAIFHGYGKLVSGPEGWARTGANMKNLGITFYPEVWGFAAMSAEFFGSILLALGILFRPAAAVLAFTMLVAMTRHLSLPPDAAGAGWKGASHALELFAVYLGLLLVGPGRYTLALFGRK
jgi:putative oxidoreductase